MAASGEKIQALMDEVYDEWRKDENKGKGKWDILGGFSEAHQIAVTFGNFNYQVENGGIDQWIYNGYFHDDAEKFTEYLEIGAQTDERCKTILDKVYTLDQYARETDCDRDGYYRDSDDRDGEGGFIGEMIDSDGFDTWYYANCGKDDWWETVSGIIDKVESKELAPVSDDPDLQAPPSHPLSVYIENITNESVGGFTMPLPATRTEMKPFLDGTEITSWRDMAITDFSSDIKGLDKRLGDAVVTSWHPDILNELNYLAARIYTISEFGGYDIFCANIEAGRNCGSVAEMVNLTFDDNLNRFDLQPCYNAEMYGGFLVEQLLQDIHADAFNRLEKSDDPADRAFAIHIEKLEKHVDLAAFGNTIVKEENGVFTEQGYLTGGDDLLEIYRGPEDIPLELFVLEEYPSELRSLSKYIAVGADKSELAYLADKITSMDAEQRSLFDAVTEAGWHCGSVSEIINVTENIHCFELQPGTTDVQHGAYSLGRADEQFADTAARLEETHNRFMLHYNMLRRSVDEEAYGHNMAKDEGGVYTKQGYLTQDSDMEPIYRGVQDLPADYRTPDAVKRATPAERSADGDKPSVLAQIAEAREARRGQPEHREPPAPGRTNSGPEL